LRRADLLCISALVCTLDSWSLAVACSYLGLGLMAARAAILKLNQDAAGHACVHKGAQGAWFALKPSSPCMFPLTHHYMPLQGCLLLIAPLLRDEGMPASTCPSQPALGLAMGCREVQVWVG